MGQSKGADARNFVHGHRRGADGKPSPTYKTWRSMKMRCDDPRNASYRLYGAKGVTYCERWKVFANFLADMGVRPDGMTLDRIDRSRGYEPGNCRWATERQQKANRCNSLTVGGVPLIVACEKAGLPYSTVWRRIKVYGLTPEEAISRPPRHPRASSAASLLSP